MSIPASLTLPSLEAFLRDRLQTPLPGPEAQRRFAPLPYRDAWDPAARPAHARQAAALLLLYPGALGPSIVLTERHADLPHHPGQISLPGGRVDEGETAAEAALREAHEEIGIDPSAVRIIGELSTLWVLVSRFVVHPIIAMADARPDFVVSPREVESLIEMPIDILHDPARRRWQRRVRRLGNGADVTIRVPYFALDRAAAGAGANGGNGPEVWGATAMILGEFGALLDPAFGPGPEPESSGTGPLPNSR